PEGPACYCGRRGCQELYLSGTGIQRMYRERTGSDLGVQQIFEASQEGSDVDAVQVMEIFLETFGQALGNLVMSLDPDVIVIGGGVSNLPILYKEGLQRVSVQVFQGRQNIRIVQNQLGDSSGVYGAAATAGTTV
ncbi:MAG: ROK family protein, partial [SAR324 cluster bacterium]|nr:ROK family protein [SAR324 cluster bacterium]